MKIRNILSSLVLAATIAAPVFISNTAQASDRCGNAYERHNYKHGYRDGYRNSHREERRHRRHQRRHHDSHYGRSHHRHSRRADYRHYGHRSGIDLIFRF
ncbi:MAG: hypothetical protein KAT25_08965 [Sulfuriflexus sp.]|nr:hypothetical protein [Sulfuriflexus sp.]